MAADKRKTFEHPHAGHRERMRKMFLESGLDGFSDYNVLELLLFYAIPKKDTNVIAHNLIEQFGSLTNVLNAPPELLCTVKGMGMYTATFLSILPQLARRYYEDKTDNAMTIELKDTEGVAEYLRSRFFGENRECFYLLAFGSDGKKIGCTKIASGTQTHIHLNERAIVEAAFRFRAVTVILAHNHPNGVAAPSFDDIRATEEISATLHACEVYLADHYIITEKETYSMASNKKFRYIFFKT